MDSKEEVLNQLGDIHSSLVDKEKFLPYNYNLLIMWGIISAILYLTFEEVSKMSIWYALGYIVGVLIIGFLFELYFIRKENIKYNLQKFTKVQTYIEANYTFAIVFAVVLTIIFTTNNLIVYAYLSCIFLFGYSDWVSGFILNNRKFTVVGLINMSVSLAIFTICILFNPALIQSSIKYIAVLFSSGGLIYLGISIKKDYELV